MCFVNDLKIKLKLKYIFFNLNTFFYFANIHGDIISICYLPKFKQKLLVEQHIFLFRFYLTVVR